jgi:hypothetical protein
MRRLIIGILLVSSLALSIASSAMAQPKISGLPRNAVIVESRKLAPAGQKNRTLVLWMISPKKNPTGYALDDIYSCPDQSRGSHYSGPTRVSLINSDTMSIINTVTISSDGAEGEDSFDIPYAIRPGNYYRVTARVAPRVEARPTIIALKDYNGDGRALEFALFEAEACMGLETTLIGYSEKQDRVIQYPVKLNVVEGGKHSTRSSLWADYLFNKNPLRSGYWKYEIDYRGRAGTLDKWEVKYNAAKEQFEGTLTIFAGDS